MSTRHKYVKRPDQAVRATQLLLDTEGFTYRKWGGEQRCRAGDWLVNSTDGQGAVEAYTVAADSFARTYRHVGAGAYLKVTPVWAAAADAAGTVATKEGWTAYQPGDYLVSNHEDGSDAYAVTKARFEQMYEPAP
jgi:hypothetical protein